LEGHSKEAKAIGNAVEATGIVIGDSFLSGAEVVADGLENGAEEVGDGLSYVVVEPVYLIPSVSSSVGQKSDMETIVAFLVVTACKEKPELVVSTAGPYLAGVLIYGITHAVCEGEVPGGYQVWQGLQDKITA